ncbi:hypothetical protein CN380_24420 [Bacillus sp. AFS017274]|nr:hypothetical protein CN380_24420 [Bacillus sp. AFS017274]
MLATMLMMLHVHFRIISDFEIITFLNSRRTDNDDGESFILTLIKALKEEVSPHLTANPFYCTGLIVTVNL